MTTTTTIQIGTEKKLLWGKQKFYCKQKCLGPFKVIHRRNMTLWQPFSLFVPFYRFPGPYSSDTPVVVYYSPVPPITTHSGSNIHHHISSPQNGSQTHSLAGRCYQVFCERKKKKKGLSRTQKKKKKEECFPFLTLRDITNVLPS